MKRPIYLNLFKIYMPVTAWVSILHRLSGLALFLGTPFVLFTLSQVLLTTRPVRGYIWESTWFFLVSWTILSAAFVHHLAGVRHLLMDLHLINKLSMAIWSAWAVILLFFGGSLGLLFWLYSKGWCAI